MIFNVTRLRENGGVLPKFRTALPRPLVGHLEIRDFKDEVGHRWTRRATLIDPATCKQIDALPPLLDVIVIRIESDYMMLTGFERILNPFENRFYDYQQSWYVTPGESKVA